MASITTKEDVEAVQEILYHFFGRRALVEEALQAAGVSWETAGNPLKPEGNKRLAQVGRMAIGLVITERWYIILDEQDVDKALDEIASDYKLSEIGRKAGLGKYVNVPDGIRRFEIPWRIMAATVQALIGAIYLERGIAGVKKVMERLEM